MKISHFLLLAAALLFGIFSSAVAIAAASAEDVVVETVIEADNADKPFAQQRAPSSVSEMMKKMNFGDRKDKARIESCVGPCLQQYPGFKEFLMGSSSHMFNGLQVMFTGDKPTLKFYDANGETIKEMFIGDKSAKEIEQILIDNGLQKRV